jgi:hypothetical protein
MAPGPLHQSHTQLILATDFMGKWAQQRKRGSSGYGTIALQPPPAPTLRVEEEQLVQHANGTDDTSGTLRLWQADELLGPWTLLYTGAWYRDWPWGALGEIPYPYLHATEVGNASNYLGESAPSNVITP